VRASKPMSNIKLETEFRIAYKIEVHISFLLLMKTDKPSTSVVVSLIVYVIVLTIIIIVAKTIS